MFRFLLTVFVLVRTWHACTFAHCLPIMRSLFLVPEQIICTSDFLFVVCRDDDFTALFVWDWRGRETVMRF